MMSLWADDSGEEDGEGEPEVPGGEEEGRDEEVGLGTDGSDAEDRDTTTTTPTPAKDVLRTIRAISTCLQGGLEDNDIGAVSEKIAKSSSVATLEAVCKLAGINPGTVAKEGKSLRRPLVNAVVQKVREPCHNRVLSTNALSRRIPTPRH